MGRLAGRRRRGGAGDPAGTASQAPRRRRRPSRARPWLAGGRGGTRPGSRRGRAGGRGLGAALGRRLEPARRARRGRHAPGAHHALPPAARLRSRHHGHEPHPEALFPLGCGPVGPGAGTCPGAGVRRLRRHRRRPALDRLRPLRPRRHHRRRSPANAGARGALGSHPRRRAARGHGVGVGRNGGNAKAGRRGLRAGDPRVDRQ